MLRLSFCGLALTMIVQPNGGLGSCSSGCSAPKFIKDAVIIQRAAAPVATIAFAPASVAVRSGKMKPIASVLSKKIAIERPAILHPDQVIGQPLDRIPVAAIISSDILSVPPLPAVKVRPAPVFAPSSASIMKTPEQRAQDAWDARQRLAYIDPILPNEFGYAEVVETAPGKLQVVRALTDLQGASPEVSGPAAPADTQEIQKNKSQASSAQTAEQKLEPLSK